MAMASRVRKLMLAVHLSFSVGWIGAAIAYLALAIAAQTSAEAPTVRGAWIAMELVGWYAIVPLAVGALVTGVVVALSTRWGLVRHWWVVFSLALTTFCVLILVMHMPTVSAIADEARSADATRLDALGGDIGHPGIGLGLLLAVLVLNVYKPRGMTRYGRRAAGRTG
jgi:membrane-bound acyltransferase YfiQ involved in biofilm formation